VQHPRWVAFTCLRGFKRALLTVEHYFEMSKIDATEAFSIYKQFIAQTDKVVDYLSVVRKLHNIVNVPVPNLKHAPTSLVKALEEYLNDPNFEENRREYKRSLGVVEGTTAGRETSPARELHSCFLFRLLRCRGVALVPRPVDIAHIV